MWELPLRTQQFGTIKIIKLKINVSFKELTRLDLLIHHSISLFQRGRGQPTNKQNLNYNQKNGRPIPVNRSHLTNRSFCEDKFQTYPLITLANKTILLPSFSPHTPLSKQHFIIPPFQHFPIIKNTNPQFIPQFHPKIKPLPTPIPSPLAKKAIIP